MATDDENDLALLKCDTSPFSGLPPAIVVLGKPAHNVDVRPTVADLDANIPEEGTEVMVSGYPLSLALVTQQGIVASKSFRYEIGVSAPTARESDLIFLDIQLNHGNSGGPVYLANSGKVVGVAEGFEPAPIESSQTKQPIAIPNPGVPGGIEFAMANSGLAFMIPAKYVVALLEKNHVRFKR